MIKFNSILVKDIKANVGLLKKIKQLGRKATGEPFIAFDEHMMIYMTYGSSGKVVAYCCISDFSPELHFENENPEADPEEQSGGDNPQKVPYLYNFITDITLRKHKISYQFLDYVKTFISETWADCKEINLDIFEDNKRADRFFEKNKFEYMGIYKKEFGNRPGIENAVIYHMRTFKFDV